MYLDFAWRYFRAKKSANAINIIAAVTTCVIAFATCCQVLVLSVFNGFEGLVKSLYADFYSDLRVIPSKGKTLFLTPDAFAALKKQPYVLQASRIAEENALLKNEENQSLLRLKAVDSNYAEVSGVPGKVVRGKFNAGTLDKPGIIVGSGIEYNAGIMVNEAFAPQLLTVILPKKNAVNNDPLESLSEGNVEATGVFAIQQDFDNNYALTNLAFVKQQMNFEPDEYSSVEIKLRAAVDMAQAQEQLQKYVGGKFIVQSRYQQNTTLYNTMRLEKWAIFAVLTLILVIAAFNMVSALTMLVLEKKRDIAILQSMGSTKGQVQKIFLTEGLLLGVVGAGSGIILALIICAIQLKFKLVKLHGGSFLIDYFPVKIVATDFLLVAATALGISFLASWFPARKAARQPVMLH